MKRTWKFLKITTHYRLQQNIPYLQVNVTSLKWEYSILNHFIVSRVFFLSLCDQILDMFARNDDLLVQMCGKLSSSCEVIPEELQKRFSSMYTERVEHINRRIANYRKVTAEQISLVKI